MARPPELPMKVTTEYSVRATDWRFGRWTPGVILPASFATSCDARKLADDHNDHLEYVGQKRDAVVVKRTITESGWEPVTEVGSD